MIELVWGGFLAAVPDAAGPRPERPAPRVGRAVGPAGAVLDRWSGSRVRSPSRVIVYGLYEYRWFGFEPGPASPRRHRRRRAVRHRLPARVVAVGRQHLRHRADLRVPEDPGALPVSRAVLGHRRRHRPARPDDRGGHRACCSTSTGCSTSSARSCSSRRCACCARTTTSADLATSLPARLVRRFVPGDQRISTAHVSSCGATASCIATPAVRGARHGRAHRRRVRGRLDPGDPRGDARPVPGLHAPTRSRSSACARLYFAVAGLMAMFRYLKYSLVLILAFVGVKMLLVIAVPRAEPDLARDHPRHARDRHRSPRSGPRGARPGSKASDLPAVRPMERERGARHVAPPAVRQRPDLRSALFLKPYTT